MPVSQTDWLFFKAAVNLCGLFYPFRPTPLFSYLTLCLYSAVPVLAPETGSSVTSASVSAVCPILRGLVDFDLLVDLVIICSLTRLKPDRTPHICCSSRPDMWFLTRKNPETKNVSGFSGSHGFLYCQAKTTDETGGNRTVSLSESAGSSPPG